MIRRSAQNRNDRKGMKNRGRGLCKKANDYHQLFGEEILVLLKAPNNGFEIGFQSRPGLFESFCGVSVPKNVLRTPKNYEKTAALENMSTEHSSVSNTESSTMGTTPSASNCSGTFAPNSNSGESPRSPQTHQLATTSGRPSAAPACLDQSPGQTAPPLLGSRGSIPRGFTTIQSRTKLNALIEECFR
ncbi:hypothetical protein FSARC_11364 [Fusarium sarcochroum]|uniref:MADS-box domain-containing protein n=1 Tax=Fusarium sarcochroum TaxID=1208366 RepID=A0A8H4X0W2_9HYPO|nr:hypothetical protein FSARC_11364 [Fusarium sarcochroum]